MMKDSMIIPACIIMMIILLMALASFTLAAGTGITDTIKNMVKGTYTMDTTSKQGMVGIVNADKQKYMCIGKCEGYDTKPTSTTTTKPETTTTSTKPKVTTTTKETGVIE